MLTRAVKLAARGLRIDPEHELLSLVPRGSVCAEIGVWKGDLSAWILKPVEPVKLHLIDPWRFEPSPEYRRAWYGGSVATSQVDMDRIHDSVVRRFGPEVADGRVEIYRATSMEAAPRFEDGSLDWIYIDGNHRYEFVRDDLEAYERKVKEGGLITGDDYTRPGWWEDGVRRAVDQFVAERGWGMSMAGNKFVIQKG